MRFFLLVMVFLFQGCTQVLPSLDGGFDRSEHAGQWLLINYWARWCKPCYEEIPDLNRLNLDQEITVLGVNFDGLEKERLTQEVDFMGITFDNLISDPSIHFGFIAPQVLPVSYLINPNNGDIRILTGKQTEQGIRQLILVAD